MTGTKTRNRIAVLFSGQIRDTPVRIFNSSIRHFLKNVEADVYLSYWSQIGRSMNHRPGSENRSPTSALGTKDYIDQAFLGLNVIAQASESQQEWEENLDESYKIYYKSNKYSALTKYSLPQIYQLWKSYNLISLRADYDQIIRMRYDFVPILPFSEITPEKREAFNINFGRAYYDDRIYDIFFGGRADCVRPVFCTWLDIPSLIEDKFDNGLDKRDACRLLFLSAQRAGLRVISTSARYGDTWRSNDSPFTYASKLVYWKLTEDSGRNTNIEKYRFEVVQFLCRSTEGSLSRGFWGLLLRFNLERVGYLCLFIGGVSQWACGLLRLLWRRLTLGRRKI